MPTIQATILAELFTEKTIFHNGAARKFMTDRRSNFTANLVNEVGIQNAIYQQSLHFF